MASPYAFTEEELKMMEKDYKKPKVGIISSVNQQWSAVAAGQEVVCVGEEGFSGQEHAS